jgi:UDP-N-acetylmuramyl tripeptide synthase
MTYPEHVATLLNDPTIDSAVLETAREGILRRGLGYECADFGIVLNMHDDHVGSDDITFLEDLAYAKSVVAEQIYPEGCAVLNADIELVLEMKSRVSSRLALFSRSANHSAVREHVAAGGLAVVLDGGDIVVGGRRGGRDGAGRRASDPPGPRAPERRQHPGGRGGAACLRDARGIDPLRPEKLFPRSGPAGGPPEPDAGP